MDNTQDTSHSMIDALTSGDSKEFEEGYKRFCILYHENIRRWCRNWFENEEDADDAAHDLLVALHRQLKKYQPQKDTRFRNWLSKVSKNMSVDVMRKKTKNKKRFANIAKNGQVEVADFMGELFLDFERRELITKALNEARGRISEREQKVLENYLKDLPAVIIAEEFELTPNTIHQAWYRIKDKLKREITLILSRRGLEEADLFAD